MLRADLKKEKPLLSVAVNAVKPEYRVLFYPYHEGASLPKTVWDDQRNELGVAFGIKHDQFQFKSNPKGVPTIVLVGAPAI
jgi:hypothetical protein